MSQSQPSAPSQIPSSSMTPEERKEKLTQCLLSQYRLCAGGVVTGAGYSVLKRSTIRPGPWPMLTGGFVGTLGDFVYGYFVECAHLRESSEIFGIKDDSSKPSGM
mmetsp:Transcript_6951/g.15859  ORF Transcript_6951/g.15859 Transcript_6951/m.15859 type:complete len:105 (-) Transcript_6951:1389-1703(-)|eukprot:CAMPEP_0172302180 /NCGR_PEP_ID=MMETSP1058-20130122/3929_1 /TAXON_ID=83371 /ORGANISM="Detonula confervacea, Strain CCMP 353" /LENGTH=104 /DNA_ID=CAMNT_0013012567 /DNA_START=122 /DNA_END=436 /DNA_ORIENTATION=-